MGVVLYRMRGGRGNHYAAKTERMAVATTDVNTPKTKPIIRSFQRDFTTGMEGEQEERRGGDVE